MLRFIEFNKDISMFIRLFGTPYEKLIEAIKAENTAEAQKLITQMNTAELSKVDNGDTALMLAASYGLDKVCEMLMPKCPSGLLIMLIRAIQL